MINLAKLHDEKYRIARAAGLPGWGGVERISNLEKMIEERFFAFSNVPSSGRLLELGCGAGNLSIELAKKGFDVSGVDFSETAIEWAKENSKQISQNIDFKVADVADLSAFSDESFDVLYDGNCLHCILGERRSIALAEWKRVLKRNGILFISSLCAEATSETFPKEFDTATRVLTESGLPYRFIPTPETIELELSSAGFGIAHKNIRLDEPFGHINIHAIKPY
ncbi:MAG: class I SAM-dependent methyltransferase [Bdellovibrio sp.]